MAETYVRKGIKQVIIIVSAIIEHYFVLERNPFPAYVLFTLYVLALGSIFYAWTLNEEQNKAFYEMEPAYGLAN